MRRECEMETIWDHKQSCDAQMTIAIEETNDVVFGNYLDICELSSSVSSLFPCLTGLILLKNVSLCEHFFIANGIQI